MKIPVDYVPTNLQLADGLTKALQNTAFTAFVDQIGLRDIEEQLSNLQLPDLEKAMDEYEVWNDD